MVKTYSQLYMDARRALLPTEGVESPSKLLREAFFRRKAAVVALVILLALFAFVFVAPAFMPMDVNYTDPLQQNVAPVYSLRKMPKKLKVLRSL